MNTISIVTGASKGIGMALVQQLLSKGLNVIGTSRSGLIPELNHPQCITYSLDLRDTISISNFVAEIEKLNRPIQLLINNAGVGPDLGSTIPDSNSFDETFSVNVKGTMMLTEQLLKLIQDEGKILNVSSKMGSVDFCTNFDSVAYRMSKSALNMYSKILANRLDKISVASIHPGWVKTTIGNSDGNSGRLTPEESAKSILDYIENRFENGDFWDAENNTKLAW